MNKKIEFPGYTAEQKRQEQKEQERITENQKRADEAASKRKAKEQKRRNSLPPFLMIRSGLLNQWVWLVILGIPLIPCGLNEEKFKYPIIVLSFLCYLAFMWACFYTDKTKPLMEIDICVIRNAISKYMLVSDYQLDLTDKISCERLAKILIQHISKYDSGLFNKMMANPESVVNMNVASNIILGHLKAHPDDAQKVLDTFDIETMPKKLYQQLKRKQR